MISSVPVVVSVNISAGGIPKKPVKWAEVIASGLAGDGHDHEKHNTPTQAVSIIDVEDIDDLRREGFNVSPGATGENITVCGLNIDNRRVGDHLRFSGGVEIKLTKPRQPCFVLDAIDPALKTAIRGRCGFLASVTRPGMIAAGETIEVIEPSAQTVLAGAILAGGLSTRMGQPKQSLKLPDGRTMIEVIASTLLCICPRLVIVGELDDRGDLPHIADLRLHAGPLGGIEALLASNVDEHYLICPCDIPLITPALLELLKQPTDAHATVFRIEGKPTGETEPLPARISVDALPTVRSLLDSGQRSVWRLMEELRPSVITITQAQAAQLHNVNTPEDLGTLSLAGDAKA